MAELLYPLGLGLTVLAVVVSFFGLRNKEFPGSKGALAGGIAVFAVLVFATMATGVKNARRSGTTARTRRPRRPPGDRARERAAQAEEVGEAGAAPPAAAGRSDDRRQEQRLRRSRRAQGRLARRGPPFAPAPAGNITITFTNPGVGRRDNHIERRRRGLAASNVVADGRARRRRRARARECTSTARYRPPRGRHRGRPHGGSSGSADLDNGQGPLLPLVQEPFVVDGGLVRTALSPPARGGVG